VSNPLLVAARGKGYANVARRAKIIGARYGVDPRRMERRLEDVLGIVQRYDCSATLPVTAAAAARHPDVIARCARRGIEFAVHGYYHVDHGALLAADQVDQLRRARRLLETIGVPAVGFRAPYLRWNDATLHAVRENGFLYDSSQAMHWPIDPGLETDPYRRSLAFYDSIPASDHPVVPSAEDGLVRIPVSLPDDETVLDRLQMESPEEIARLWLGILHRVHELGELFTMQVHPERIEPCAPGIVAVLEEARSLRPHVWIARLDEIARWWVERAASEISIREGALGRSHLTVRGPKGVTLLARGLAVPAAEPWANGYVRLAGTELDLPEGPRPFIGIHPSCPQGLARFLREQGYLVDITERPDRNTTFLERQRFARADERPLLDEIERGGFPLLRMGRWPAGARSALAITGDVDALTIWDYGFRFLGR